ncbi:hypothetical protein HD554DRAFT_2131246 [Boletus coccyginus]|nr:hypothetical protein HD554DRAFT_2131246 [Boletus coccyginus]
MRQTTHEEDIAHSLFGIFNDAIPVMYGKGNQAVGRLLEHILTRSDNVTLFAWTGRDSSSQHSYLPWRSDVLSTTQSCHRMFQNQLRRPRWKAWSQRSHPYLTFP